MEKEELLAIIITTKHLCWGAVLRQSALRSESLLIFEAGSSLENLQATCILLFKGASQIAQLVCQNLHTAHFWVDFSRQLKTEGPPDNQQGQMYFILTDCK